MIFAVGVAARSRCVEEAIRDACGIPIYRPAYSPELNPIERLWADMKRRLQTLAVTAQGHLLRAVP